MALDDRHEAEGRVFKVVGTRPIRPDGVDKVTGRARFGADMNAPGMLVGLVLRSPHAHARIRGIDTAKARALPGVKAVVTSADFADVSANISGDLRDTLHNVMAHGKALYDGHAVAAVAATSASVAKQALKLIAVDYEVLPHVTDVDEAMKPDAPVLHEGRSDETVPQGMSGNVMHRFEYGHGDVEAGFAEADEVIERCFKTAATHQGYIEPHACLASMGPDGQADLWCCTQGHYMVRNTCAGLLGMDVSQLKVTASEIGGGFGGKTTVFLEPVALALSRISGRPVKMVMTRDEVLRAQSSPVQFGAMACFAAYDLKNVQAIGWDVVANRPKAAAYRAPGAPMGTYVVESVIDELCDKLGLDKVDVRLKNASRDGTKAAYGPRFGKIGLTATLEAAKAHPHWTAPLGPNQGRGLACGFWFNFGGDTCVTLNVNADGTVGVSEGNPDIGGSRASMTMMAAEELGIPYERVRTTIADTSALGQNEVTDGSRVTFAVGLATIKAARDAIQKMCARAAKIWDIDPDAVVWEDGHAKPAGPNAGKFPPMSLAEIAAVYANTGGPIAGHHEVTAEGAGVSFATHMVDAEVDPETGAVKIIRYTVFQDAGKAVHPAYVEGQFQGGAAQGIGWALNEEYIYGSDGRLQNPGFLDYRIPVASDLPMIDTVIVEVPNPGHPYGVRGVGETSIVPPLAAISNAVSAAAGVRMTELPMSPPVVLKAIGAARS
jgi:CO/xanthine dehydrogenase Mo-binding subunit